MATDWRSTIRTFPDRLASLVNYLRLAGYQFEEPNAVLPGPSPEVEKDLLRLEQLVGAVPLALAEFHRYVGAVDLRGSHPNWRGCELPDPLVIDPLSAAIDEAQEYSKLADPAQEYWASLTGVFRAPIAPDAYHKADMSGGMWLGVEIPNANEDPVVLEATTPLPLTQYVEHVLSWGGFPGLATSEHHDWPLGELRRAGRITGQSG